MRVRGKQGYLLNVLEEHGTRTDALIKSLNEEKKIQCAFISDFVKANYINVTKILLYLILKGKVRTDVDGLFIDKEFSSYLTFQGEHELKQIDNAFVKQDMDTTLKKIDNHIELQDEQKKREQEKEEEMKKENMLYADDNWRKIQIKKFEMGNIMNIMLSDGTIGNVENLIYYLNPCSVLAVHFLKVKKGDKVLDMCASPGGKSIVIARKLFGYKRSPINRIRNMKNINLSNNPNDVVAEIECDTLMKYYCTLSKTGYLVSNEYSRSRYERLEGVLKKYIPKEILYSNNLEITKYNGLYINQFSRFRNFDKILLDAPCSSDSYLIQNENELNKWTPNVIKYNTITQFQLLCNAFELLKRDGILIYSTCALSPQENDGVIDRLQKKYASAVKIIDFIEEEFMEKKKEAQNKSQNKTCLMSLQKNKENQENDEKNLCNKWNYLSFFERTKHGYISMPDKSPFGLLYICKIKKV